MTRLEDTAAWQLKSSSLFHTLAEADLADLTPPPETILLQAGEVLMRQGDLGTDYFHLVSGQLRIFIDGKDGEPVRVREVNPGGGVGEMSLVTGDPRSATVTARVDSKLIRVSQAALLKMIERHPAAAIEIARIVIQRLGSKPHGPTYKRIAILPLQRGIDTGSLARNLAQALERFGISRAIDSRSEAPDRYDPLADVAYAVYDGGHETNGWSKHCFLHADLVLFAARAGTNPDSELTQHMTVAAETDPRLRGRTDLLMVHPSAWDRKSETGPWIRETTPCERHHLRLGNSADMARLARVVAGRAVNVVLSGGGARSFAEFGVLQAFRDAGLPVDRLVGCSMGAFVGATYAYDGAFDTLIALARQSFRKRNPIWDFTLPIHSFLRGNRLLKVATDVCGDWRLENLPIGMFCLSSDLGNAEVVIHDEGPVWTALRATAAMPVLGPPLLLNGRVLIDGGALNNMPVDIMRERHSGPVIAVNVSNDRAVRMDPRWELQCPSGFEILRNRLNPFERRAKIPGIFEILYHTMNLATQARFRQTCDKADWLIEPPVEEFGVVDFGAFDKLVESAYHHTKLLLEEMKANPGLAESRGLGGLF
jgi:NTE family protein